MKKIEKLTKEQEKYLVEFRKKWLDVGLCCDPADFGRAEKQITFFYEKLGKKKPMFFKFSSPLTAELGCHALDYILENREKFFGANLGDNLADNLGDNLADNLWANLRANLADNLWANLRANLWANLRDNLADNLGDNLRDNLRAKLWANLGDNLADNLWANLGAKLWDNLADNLWANLRANLADNLGANLWANLRANLGDNLADNLGDNLRDNLRAKLWDNLRAKLWDNLWANLRAKLWDNLGAKKKYFLDALYYWGTGGQLDAFWVAFYKFGEELGVKYKDSDLALLNAWGALSESACFWMPYENICIISDRPCFISKDESGRLHNETRMAVEFRDGYGLYMWHGVEIPSEWVVDKKSLTPEIALKWQNVEQRRAACEILGWANVLEHPSLNPKIINEDLPHIGTLIQIDLPDAPEQWFIKYQCGTGRWFAEAVNDKRYNTALLANAAGNGFRGQGDPESFIPLIRT